MGRSGRYSYNKKRIKRKIYDDKKDKRKNYGDNAVYKGRKAVSKPRTRAVVGSGGREILFGIHSVREALKAGKRKIYKIFVSCHKLNQTLGTNSCLENTHIRETKSIRDTNPLSVIKSRNLKVNGDSIIEKDNGCMPLLNKRIRRIIDNAEDAGIPFELTDHDYLDRITVNDKHQGIAAEVSAFPYLTMGNVLDRIKKNNLSNIFVLIIEHLEDPHNLGALIRTALCAGADFIFIPKDRAVSALPSASKASAGAMEHASICLVSNIVATMKDLKKHGFWIAGLDADGSCSLFEADMTGNIALVVGGEHMGLRPLVRKECDFILSLPMKGNINSLNASVAGGIAMYEVVRQRENL